RSYARFAGLFYLLVLAVDIAGVVVTYFVAGSGGFAERAHNIGASEGLYRIGLCLGLLGSLSTIPLATCLYVAVRPADGNLAMMALLFRAAEAAIGGIGMAGALGVLQVYLAANHPGALDAEELGLVAKLHPLGTSTAIAAIFFCLGSTIFFYVFFKSRYIPRILSAWGMFASVVYLASWFTGLVAPNTSDLVNLFASLPILIAEVSTGLWLLIAGIKPERFTEPATG
ncbi:MAG TPA: DUF4386 domain-containing protein, partial [Candidatus Dormibacteraeota bacterium]